MRIKQRRQGNQVGSLNPVPPFRGTLVMVMVKNRCIFFRRHRPKLLPQTYPIHFASVRFPVGHDAGTRTCVMFLQRGQYPHSRGEQCPVGARPSPDSNILQVSGECFDPRRIGEIKLPNFGNSRRPIRVRLPRWWSKGDPPGWGASKIIKSSR